MAQKAIRTTLPNGSIALNSVIDKHTGGSIQAIKINALPSGVSPDGVVFIETNDPIHGVEYWRRVITDGVVDVQWFGAVCDYRGASTASDNTAAIESAIDTMKSLVSGQQVNDSRQNTYTLRFPSDSLGYGYYVTDDLDFGGGYNIQMDAPLYRGGSKPADGAFVTVGQGSDVERLGNRHKDHKLWVRTESVVWTGGEYFGIVVKNHVRTKINIVESRGFECGVRFYGHNSAFSYNSDIFIGEIINSRIGLDWYATGEGNSGYVTSCITKIGRIGQDSTTNTSSYAYERVGIRLNSEAYIPESLTFNGGVIEGLTPTNVPGVDGIPVDIIKGQLNHFYNFRNEGNSAPFLRIVNDGSHYGNTADLTYSSNNNPDELISPTRVNNYVDTRRGMIPYSLIGRGRTLYSTGDMVDKIKVCSPSGDYIIDGLQRRTSAGNYSPIIQGASIESDYLRLSGPGPNIGFVVDTRHCKSFIININQDPDAVCTLHFECLDANKTVIPRADVTGLYAGYGYSSVLPEGFVNYTPFWESNTDFGIKVDEQVSYIRLHFYAAQQGGAGLYLCRIKSIGLLSAGGRFEAPVTAVKLLGSGATASRPSNIYTGYEYFDTDLGKPIYWNGSAWVDATGTTV